MDLRQCQKDALACIQTRLETGEKETNISMCTGAGKSIVICVATSDSSRRYIIVFPWLDLMRQYFKDHATTYTALPCVRYLATEGTLTEISRISPEMTELDESAYVIFTTYTSAPLLYANVHPDRAANLTILHDEAHRTERSEYKLAYTKIQEYIHYTINLSATLPDSKPPHYKYSLLRGIADGVVRDFHMELFLCTSSERNQTQLIITILRKLLALHKQVKLLIYTAEANTEGEESSSVKTFLSAHRAALRALGWWVDGITADTKDRDSLMRMFEKKRDVSILVSCKTLNEGITIKNANAVLPWDPSRSVVDNVQRIGRVLRLYRDDHGKPTKNQSASTVMIPIFLSEEKYAACNGDREAIHTVLSNEIANGERGDFRPIVNVCTALKSELAEDDPELFNRLLLYPNEPRVAVDNSLVECVAKQCKKSVDTVLEEMVELLKAKPDAGLDEEQYEDLRSGEWDETIHQEVATALADSQGITLVVRDGEDVDQFGKGDTTVTVEKKEGEEDYKVVKGKKAVEKDKEAVQKRIAQRMRLDFSDACKILLSLSAVEGVDTEGGYVLSRLTTEVRVDNEWEKRRLEWVDFYQKYGVNPSHGSKVSYEKRIGQWVSDQRINYKKGNLSPKRIESLISSPGWLWEIDRGEKWEKIRLEYVSFYQKNGKDPSGGSKDPNERRVGSWVNTQRVNYKKGTLSSERIAILNAMPYWTWGLEEQWEYTRLEYMAFYQKHGKQPSQYSKHPDEKRLGYWGANQRSIYQKGNLSSERFTILNSSPGWDWGKDRTEITPEEIWEQTRLEYITFYQNTGKRPTSRSDNPEERRLCTWCQYQRNTYKEGKLSAERIKLLASLPGWIWEKNKDDEWEKTYQRYTEFYQKYGKDPSARSKCPEEKQLGQWIINKRQDYKKGNLSPEHINILNNTIGWSWGYEEQWEHNRMKYVTFYQKEGVIPSHGSENPEEKRLAAWICTQRCNYKKGTLSTERIAALNASPGWKWTSSDDASSVASSIPDPDNVIVHIPPSSRTRPSYAPPSTEPKPTSASPHQRQRSRLEEFHQRFKTMNAATYTSTVTPADFHEYHQIADSYDARDPTERQPLHKIATLLAKFNKPTYTAIDLGCGKNRLRQNPSVNRMSWTSVDVHAMDETVTIADMGSLPYEDETYDIAILSRSLWARNHLDVMQETFRILKSGGRAVICESFRRWLSKETQENTLLHDLKTIGFEIIYEEGTRTDDTVEDVFQYVMVRKS